MKNYLKIGMMILTLTSCASQRKAKPCNQCPQYTYSHGYLEYLTLNSIVEFANNKIKLNGDKKFNKSNSTTRGIIF
jgi:hypothetical protein